MTAINPDERWKQWRRRLAQIRAEHPEHATAAQFFYDCLPMNEDAFNQFYRALCTGGKVYPPGTDIAEAMGWNEPNFCGSPYRREYEGKNDGQD